MAKRKFWCHYIGGDGNTPKRRSIELTSISDIVPCVDNEGVKTPLWVEREDGDYHQVYYLMYAQLSENVAVIVNECPSSYSFYETLQKTDEQIDAHWQQWLEKYCEEYPQMSEERKAKEKEFSLNRAAEEKEIRLRKLEFLKQLQDYDAYLTSGEHWVDAAAVKAYEEAGSPLLPVLQGLRAIGLQRREAERQARREAARKEAEEKARREAEKEAKERERLAAESEKFKAGGNISGKDVVELCRQHNIPMHLRTVHNLQQVVVDINGKNPSCRFYRTRGRRKPQLDGCYEVASKLYKHLRESA